MKEEFQNWFEFFATDEERALPKAEQAKAFMYFLNGVEDFCVAVKQFDEECDDWGLPKRGEGRKVH
jgi:hypothetical protein